MFGTKKKTDEENTTKKEPLTRLHGNEEILEQYENGYTFHSGDGAVKYRTYAQHDEVIESRKFTEPEKQPVPTFRQHHGLPD